MRILIASVVYGDVTAPGAEYSHAIERVGGEAFFCGSMDAAGSKDAAERFDGLVLAGGGDMDAAFFGEENHPMSVRVPRDRDFTELRLAESFVVADKPILAICRGIQVLNVAFGGSIMQHIGDVDGYIEHQDEGMRHDIDIEKEGILSNIFKGSNRISVNSTHHQAVGRLGQNIFVEARSADGVVEAISTWNNVLGVQFHPELMLSEGMLPLWKWFAGTRKA